MLEKNEVAERAKPMMSQYKTIRNPKKQIEIITEHYVRQEGYEDDMKTLLQAIAQGIDTLNQRLDRLEAMLVKSVRLAAGQEVANIPTELEIKTVKKRAVELPERKTTELFQTFRDSEKDVRRKVNAEKNNVVR